MPLSRFTTTTFLITGGLLIWALDFAFVYTFVAIACARGFADARMLGTPLVSLAIGIATVASAAAVAALMIYELRLLRREASGPVTGLFISRVAVACAALAFVAILWTGLVAALPAPRC